MFAFVIALWKKVIRVFIPAVRQLADSRARGEKERGLLHGVSISYKPLILLHSNDAGINPEAIQLLT